VKSKSVISVLKEGLVINTRFSSRNIWYQNVVCKVKNNLVYLPLIKGYLQNIIMPGSNLIIKYSIENFEYVFEGIVCEIVVDDFAYIVLKINKSEEIINSRVFLRYDTYLAANITPCESSASIFSIILNISLTGIAFVSKYEFDYSEDNEVIILIPGHQRIYGKGKIIRKSTKNDCFDYSMQFTDMDDFNNNILASYLTQLETDMSDLQKNYEQNLKDRFND